MPKLATDGKRYRFTVPFADEAVQEWLNAQLNISNSIRILIRDEIQKNGYVDASCRPVGQMGKRGRPSNAEIEMRQSVVEKSENVVDFSDKSDVKETEPVKSEKSVRKSRENRVVKAVEPVNQDVESEGFDSGKSLATDIADMISGRVSKKSESSDLSKVALNSMLFDD
jgi:hypothetical protein